MGHLEIKSEIDHRSGESLKYIQQNTETLSGATLGQNNKKYDTSYILKN